MRIFVSAGEPSGDIHAANLIRALRARRPDLEFVGFGGDRMAEAGCSLLYPLCRLAVMWFARVLAHVPTFLSLVSRADRYFAHHRPDAVVLIDYPGFNWWMARRAHFRGIPVYWFVPPQLWGWAGWRVKKMRRWVDEVLCSLPFEEPWYHQRGVAARHVGHPFFDELPDQRLDTDFVQRQRSAGAPIVALLPGSRTQEVERNLSTLVRAAQAVHQARPDARFLVASFREPQRKMVEDYLRRQPPLPIETHVGRTPEIIELAQACIAVSGSVSLELLYRGTPTAVVYRVGALDLRVARYFMTTPYISLVNLLAGKELFPEFLTDRCEAAAIAHHVRRWLENGPEALQLRAELTALRGQVAVPGACERAADAILTALAQRRRGAA